MESKGKTLDEINCYVNSTYGINDKLHLIVLSKNAINENLTEDEIDLIEIKKIEQENVWFSNEQVTSVLGFDLFD